MYATQKEEGMKGESGQTVLVVELGPMNYATDDCKQSCPLSSVIYPDNFLENILQRKIYQGFSMSAKILGGQSVRAELMVKGMGGEHLWIHSSFKYPVKRHFTRELLQDTSSWGRFSSPLNS
ncbi:uncharacterized protein LOC127804044 isoform X1 [Diospyros lotus]|uniref:uncharacterized protein LOC127804044 isoform X1 n=1 Tax=Diospyros lotus TaxID=55363 RepID=UPI00224FF1DF|nr:uncharacterized protein LOC127804044 isoform X1 [Diospyros lotus]